MTIFNEVVLAEPGQLLAWASDSASSTDFSPLGEQAWLLFDSSAAEQALTAVEQQGLARWLSGLACPVLGLAAQDQGGVVSAACDVRLASRAEAAGLLANIRTAPIAASVLVQLLRATEGQPLAAGLLAESLAYSTLQAGPEYRRWLATHRAERPAAHSDSGPAVAITREGDALHLQLNRPSNRNAMTVEMRDALVEALQLVHADDSVRSVQFSGRGRCFSTGGDLTEFGTAPDPATAHIVRSLALPGRLLAAVSEKVCVRVHGACVGSGIEFPAFAGRIEAAADAWFQLPELQFGLLPGAGGCVSIARRIGRQRCAWMVLSGHRIKAQTALDWGLVDAVITDASA